MIVARCAALCVALGVGHPGAQPPVVEHVWKPVRGGGANVVAIEVRTTVRELSDSARRRFVLDVPITYAGVPGIADRVEGLVVRDTRGEVTLTRSDDPPHPGGFPHYRHLRAARDVVPPVVYTYRSTAPRDVVGGPPFGLYAAHGGLSGAGSGFLVLPEGRDTVESRILWDVSDLAAGATAVTTWGEGAVTVRGSANEVRQGWIMAGPLGRYEASTAGGFSAAWLGTPAWDPASEMDWAARMYAWLGTAYGYLSPLPSYRVFIRVGGRGATALPNSFMLGTAARSAGELPRGEAPRETIAHEMGHLFVGSIDAPLGVASWFTEGLNTYYTRLLPMRGGFVSVEDYADAVNRDFSTYYASPARNLSADSIVRVGFTDERVRRIPYTRGSVYFAELDSQIRTYSRGQRNLDVVLRELFTQRAAGAPFNHDVWIATVIREAGPTARDAFVGTILRGDRTVIPPSDAFGPCLARREVVAPEGASRRDPGYQWVRVTGIPDADCRRPW